MPGRSYNTFSYPAGFAPGYDPTHLASTQSLRLSCVATATKQMRSLFPNYGVGVMATNATFGMDALVGPVAITNPYSEIKFSKTVEDKAGTYAAILLGPSGWNLGGGSQSQILSDSAYQVGGAGLHWDNTDGHLFGAGGISSPYGWVTATPIIMPLRQPIFIAFCYKESGPACFVLRNLLTGALRAEPSTTTNSALGSTSSQFFYMIGCSRFNAEGGDEKYNCAMFSGDYLGMEALVKWSEDPWAFWYPRRIKARKQKGSDIVVQLLRPDTDTSISDWTDQADGTTTIFNSIDETSFSDTDYIKSPTPPNASVARFRMSNPTAGRTLDTPVVVAYRFKKTNSDDQQLDVSLKQGTTLIASWAHSGAGLTESFQTVQQTLSSGEFASITDFNDLFIEFKAGPVIDGDANDVLILHMDSNFTDASIKQRGTAAVVADATISTADKKFGAASGYFDGSADQITYPNHADWAFGSGDFTLDCWFNSSGLNGNTRAFFGGQADSAMTATTRTIEVALYATNKVLANVWSGGTNTTVAGTTTIDTPGWHHAALVRTGNILKLFVDGVQEGGDVAFSSAVQSSTGVFIIGRLGSGSTWYGFLDEVRVSKGIARWTANFTPPTSAYT